MPPAVLLVDDDPSLLVILDAVFRSVGFETFTAANGRSAMKQFEAHEPDLVVTDILMPEQEGIETLRKLKAHERPPQIIAMSGGGRFGEGTLLEWARTLGADATLHKPFSPSALLRLANALLATTTSIPGANIHQLSFETTHIGREHI